MLERQRNYLYICLSFIYNRIIKRPVLIKIDRISFSEGGSPFLSWGKCVLRKDAYFVWFCILLVAFASTGKMVARWFIEFLSDPYRILELSKTSICKGFIGYVYIHMQVSYYSKWGNFAHMSAKRVYTRTIRLNKCLYV